MRAGQRSYIPGVGHIVIEKVEEVRLEDLTEADALADGFATLQELHAALAELYPANQAAGRKLFRVTFSLAPRDPSPRLDTDHSGTAGPLGAGPQITGPPGSSQSDNSPEQNS